MINDTFIEVKCCGCDLLDIKLRHLSRHLTLTRDLFSFKNYLFIFISTKNFQLDHVI